MIVGRITGPLGSAAMSLRLEGVSYRYAGSTATVLAGRRPGGRAGEVVGLVGANEAGKTTLCLVAAGLAPGHHRRPPGGHGPHRRPEHRRRAHRSSSRSAAARSSRTRPRSCRAPRRRSGRRSPSGRATWPCRWPRSWHGWTRPSGCSAIGDLVGATRPASRAARRSSSPSPGSSPCGRRTSSWTSRRSQLDPQGTRLVGDALAALAAQAERRGPDRRAQDRSAGGPGVAGGGDRGWAAGGRGPAAAHPGR